MLSSISIYTRKKLNKITDQLKKEGRQFSYDIFHDDVCKIHYILWYKVKEVK